MKIYCIVYPSDFSDAESHNQMMDNIGVMRWKPITDGLAFLFSDLTQEELAKVLFKDVSPSYKAVLFLISDTTTSPKCLLQE